MVVVTGNEQPRRYIYDKTGRDRQRVKRCPQCLAVVQEHPDSLSCLGCGWTSTREQVAR